MGAGSEAVDGLLQFGVGLEPAGGLEVIEPLGDAAGLRERGAEIDVDVGIVGLEAESGLVFGESVGRAACLGQPDAEIEAHGGLVIGQRPHGRAGSPGEGGGQVVARINGSRIVDGALC